MVSPSLASAVLSPTPGFPTAPGSDYRAPQEEARPPSASLRELSSVLCSPVCPRTRNKPLVTDSPFLGLSPEGPVQGRRSLC